MDGGLHSPVYEWLADTVVSLSDKFGISALAPLENADGASLAQQMPEEALQKREVVVAPMMVRAFARKKGTSTN